MSAAFADPANHRPPPTAVLLTGIDLRTRPAADELSASSSTTKARRCRPATPIVRREAVRRAYGTTPTHLHGYDDVLTELMEALIHV